MSETRSGARRSAAAIVVAVPLLVAIFALSAPLRAASAADAAPGEATWGIRHSYRNYINGPIAHGEIVASDGAQWLDGTGNAKGPFTFPVETATYDPDTGLGSIELAGSIYTGGHDYGSGYILELELDDLRFEIDGDEGTVVADLTYRPFVGANPNIPPPPVQTADDVEFATVDLSTQDLAADPDGTITITDAPTVGITEAMELIGWDLFYSYEMPNPTLDAFSLAFSGAPGDPSNPTTTGPDDEPTTTGPTTTVGDQPTTTGPTTTAPIESGDAIITGGQLSWGVYQNFVRYVTGPIAHGTITTTQGASGAPAGPFLFPVVPGDEVDVTANDLTIPFSGRVQFRGHVYDDHPPALEMAFSNLRVEKSGSTGKLIADVTSRPFIDMTSVAEPVTTLGAHLADLDFSQVRVGSQGDGVAWLAVPAAVSTHGAPLFGDFYEAGQVLDPVTIALTLSEVPDDLEEATPPPAPTGPIVTVGSSSVTAGGTVSVSADGFTPNEQVEAWLHSTPTFLQMVRADATGRVSAAVTIPPDTPAGMHRVELRGLSSGTSAFSSPFQVIGSGAARQRSAATGAGRLPSTGSSVVPIVIVGAGLVLVGALLSAPGARRRTRPEEPLG